MPEFQFRPSHAINIAIIHHHSSRCASTQETFVKISDSPFQTQVWKIPGPVDDDWLSKAAMFFSENYGIWGPLAAEKMGKILGNIFKPPSISRTITNRDTVQMGSRVKLSPKRLKEAICPPGGANIRSCNRE